VRISCQLSVDDDCSTAVSPFMPEAADTNTSGLNRMYKGADERSSYRISDTETVTFNDDCADIELTLNASIQPSKVFFIR
jgi:hypothetical protein